MRPIVTVNFSCIFLCEAIEVKKIQVVLPPPKLTFWPLMMELIECPETSVRNYHCMLHIIAEERRSERNVAVRKDASVILKARNLFSLRCPKAVYFCKENSFSFRNEVFITWRRVVLSVVNDDGECPVVSVIREAHEGGAAISEKSVATYRTTHKLNYSRRQAVNIRWCKKL
jgi:hypothetical protein